MMDHKKAIATMIAKRDPKDGTMSTAPMKAEITKDDDGALDGRHSAAEDMIMAIKEGSAQKLMEAMVNFHAIHESMEDEPEVEE